jgi:TRAF3-interacting protein 1
MSEDFWKPTAECFEQLFSKPKMTEKLLLRPPFRYIHDIFTATLQATGFGDGLYSEEELNAKEIKDKEGKVNFLDKLVALVQFAAGEEIPVKSSKIVAGQEPEATNIFLQYLFKVATSGIDSGPIVAQILGEGGDEGNQQDDGEEEAAAAAAEEEARRAAEEEQRKKDKRNQKKKQMEEEKLRQQAKAEAERKAQEKREAEEAAAKAKAAKKAPPKKAEEPPAKAQKKSAIIEEGQDDADGDDNIIDEEDNGMNAGIDINDVDPESKFGKKAMAQLRAQEEEEEADRNLNDDNAAGGVKMGKIRRGNRKKAGGVERSEPQKKALQAAPDMPQRSFGGYKEEEIEYLRKSIQMLCQNTNPLGKSIDFVTEDIDSMVKEYDHWKRDYIESQSKLEEQQKITEQTIQPLQDVQLAQLEERIREEKSKIQNIRSQIIRNDTVIQNLLVQ